MASPSNTKGCICTTTCKHFSRDSAKIPSACPTRAMPEVFEKAGETYRKEGEDARTLWKAFSRLVGTGGASRSRVEHIIEFSTSAGFKTIGIAGCVRYITEMQFLRKLFAKYGFESHVAVCKMDGLGFDDIRIEKESDWIICNPLAQAELLNGLQCDLNVTLGLCMGHDLIFGKYSEAYVTNLVVKEKISDDAPSQTIKAMMDDDYKLNLDAPLAQLKHS